MTRHTSQEIGIFLNRVDEAQAIIGPLLRNAFAEWKTAHPEIETEESGGSTASMLQAILHVIAVQAIETKPSEMPVSYMINIILAALGVSFQEALKRQGGGGRA